MLYKNEKRVGKLEMEMKQYFEQIHKPISLYKQRPIFNMKDVTSGILCDVCGMKIDLGKGNGMYTKCSCCEIRKSKEEWIRFALQEYQILVNRSINYTESVRWIRRAHRNLVKKFWKSTLTVQMECIYLKIDVVCHKLSTSRDKTSRSVTS